MEYNLVSFMNLNTSRQFNAIEAASGAHYSVEWNVLILCAFHGHPISPSISIYTIENIHVYQVDNMYCRRGLLLATYTILLRGHLENGLFFASLYYPSFSLFYFIHLPCSGCLTRAAHVPRLEANVHGFDEKNRHFP